MYENICRELKLVLTLHSQKGKSSLMVKKIIQKLVR